MTILIIEDEKVTAEALERMIRSVRSDAQIIAKIRSVEAAIDWLETHTEPDLLFCDIHLSDGNSFEIFKNVSVNCPVIFSTAYNQYAIEAFQVNSIDYLLKPLNKKEVAKALKKYEALYHERKGIDIESLEKAFLHSKKQQSPSYRSRYMAKIGDTIKPVDTEDIAYFYIEDGEVVLTTFKGKRYLPNYSLDQLDEQLNPNVFFRANRQLIVNIKAVKELHPYFKGRLILKLDPPLPEQIVISSGKVKAFKKWLER
jgi:DNA-binding LytR/AlgR family response regulator